MLAGTESGGIYRSTDGGQSWAPANTGVVSVTTRAFAMIGTTIFAGTTFDGDYLGPDAAVEIIIASR